MEHITIRDIKVFVTAPRNINLVVVKVETSEPELYGYGCATFTWRHKAVVTAIEEYLAPMLKGRPVEDIEGLWQTMMGSSYWRNGPVLNNAISGVDEALWDIKGKMAGMPLYSLLGGKCREGITVYRHADGGSVEEVEECIQKYMEEGYRYIRTASDAFLAGLGYAHEGNGYRVTAHSDERIAVFCHQGFGLSWLGVLLDIPLPVTWTTFDISHSDLTVIEFAGHTGNYCVPKMLTLSNDSHLYAEGLPTRYQNVLYF